MCNKELQFSKEHPKWLFDPEKVQFLAWIQELFDNHRQYVNANEFKINLENDPGKLNQLIFEMILGNILTKNGFTLGKVKAADMPDLCIIHDDKRIWIECIMPHKGEGEDSVPDIINDKNKIITSGGIAYCQERPEEQIILRLTNALGQKRKQYQRWLDKGICEGNEPFIIAIHGLNIDAMINKDRLPDIMKALYGMGNLIFPISPKGNCANAHYQYRQNIEKKSGANVNTTFFYEGK